MRAIAILFLFVLLSTNACAFENKSNADEEAIKAFGDTWLAAYSSGDLETLATLYEPDALLMAAGQPAKKGKEAILAYFASRAGSGADLDMNFEYEDLTIDGDYAFSIAIYRLKVTPPGADPIKIAGRSFLVFKRGDDGRWRVWRDMDNQTPDVAFE